MASTIQPLWDQMPLGPIRPAATAAAARTSDTEAVNPFTDIFQSAVNAVKETDMEKTQMRMGEVRERAALIITDLEMPQMDGHRLTKLVKDDEELRHIPLIIFSSLISDEMRIKGKELGADEQMSKPEIGHLVSVMDRLLARVV